MSAAPAAEVLAIGDELTHGHAIDTNSAWLAGRLEDLGLHVGRFGVVSDDPQDLETALREACARADVVVSTGGLGPTEDDRTRHAAAAAAGVELRFDEPSWSMMGEWFRARGRRLGDENRRQALLPAGGTPLCNSRGTAPGLHLAIGGTPLYALPGVPGEMKAMFAEEVAPRLREAFGSSLRPFAHRALRAIGPTEAALGERLVDLMSPGGDVRVGVTAHYGLLTVRVAAAGDTAAEAERRAEEAAARLRPLLGDWLVYEGDDSLPERLVAALAERRLTVATAESCTGGLVARLLTDVAGASQVFPGGWVTYSNERKEQDLGVPRALLEAHGAVSVEVAAAMAEGAAARAGADLGLAITGIAGPDGGTDDKPVGTVCFGLRAGGTTRSWRRQIPAVDRRFVRERSAFEALGAVLRHLRDGAFPGSAPSPVTP